MLTHVYCLNMPFAGCGTALPHFLQSTLHALKLSMSLDFKQLKVFAGCGTTLRAEVACMVQQLARMGMLFEAHASFNTEHPPLIHTQFLF